MEWKVRLEGKERGLETVAESFNDDPEVFRDDENFFLWSGRFEDLEDSNEIRSRAEEVVRTIRNLGVRDSLNIEDLQASHVYKINEDGTEQVFVRTEPATIGISAGSVRVTTIDEDGNKEVHQPADRTYELTKLALEDEKVEELVNLLDQGDEWVNLYRIYEFIQSNIDGEDNIVERDWWSSSEKDLFKQTANSRDAIGDDARHAGKNIPAPEDPLNHSDAKSLIDSLVQNWLEHRQNT